MLVIDVDANSVNVERRRIGTWEFVSHDWQLSSDEDIDVVEEWLSSLQNKDRAIVKLALVGQVSLAQKARLDAILEHNADLLGALETWERRSDLIVIPDEMDHERLGLSGFAKEALLDLREMAGSGDKTQEAQDALALLYRLAGPRP